MASIISCNLISPRIPNNGIRFATTQNNNSWLTKRLVPKCSKNANPCQKLKECAISIALAVGLITGMPSYADANVNLNSYNWALPDLSVLISGPPIKDPGALLRYALPIDNKAVREVQKPLEDITESLKIAGVKALDSVERNVRQTSQALKQGKSLIVSGLAESKKDHGLELLDKLEAGMDEL